jgi:hypothetical protein
MLHSIKLTIRIALLTLLLFITLAQVFGAVPAKVVTLDRDLMSQQRAKARVGAHANTENRLPGPVSFRLKRDRGLLVDTWVNGSGPYAFAIDTGAGGTIISTRVAAELHIAMQAGRTVSLAGLSGREIDAHEAVVKSLAVGQAENLLPANHSVIVGSGLPNDVDGILDPTEAFAPFGYVIDFPHHELTAFDSTLHPLSISNPPAEGAVVHWLTQAGNRRPFVRLDDGRLVLLDTGSAFGLAISDRSAAADERAPARTTDIGGGSVSSRRVRPTNVSIGTLTLRSVPTDILNGADKGAPALLGRDALYPFKMVFDPVHKLIAISPAK